jgi:predicted transcriptional regulator
MATEQGRAAETLVQEAVERFLNYDEWFSREVDKGLAAADRGEFIEHDDKGPDQIGVKISFKSRI